MTHKTEIAFTGQYARMTHKQIADLVNSRPDNVKVSIERLAERGVIRLPAMQEIGEINNLGLAVKREYYCFEGEQGKRDSIVVVAQLSPEFTAQIVDEWQALEKAVEFLQIPEHKPAPQAISMHSDILSLARVVAEATASATMKAVMDVMDARTIPAPELPQRQPAPPTTAPEQSKDEHEYALVTDLVWKHGLSDAACRRLASFSGLPTQLTNGARGHLMIDRISFADAVTALIEGSTPPSGKRKRWKHPDFGGFELKITEANKAAVEARQ